MITDHPILDGFHAALERRPTDWTTRLILADWYEEQGDAVTAAAIRWQVKNRKRPYGGVWYNQANQVNWSDDGRVRHAWSDLPARLFELLTDYDLRWSVGSFRDYDSYRLAEEALWRAWPLWKARKHPAREKKEWRDGVNEIRDMVLDAFGVPKDLLTNPERYA